MTTAQHNNTKTVARKKAKNAKTQKRRQRRATAFIAGLLVATSTFVPIPD